MNIEINEKYRLTSDPMNFIIQERYKSKKGEWKWKNISYCNNLTNTIRSLCRHMLLSSPAVDCEGLTESLKEVEAVIDTLESRMAEIEPEVMK